MAGKGQLVRAFKELPIEAMRLLGGRYPDFVLSSPARPRVENVPVFMFHTVVREPFTAQLAHLKRNNYQTLTLAEFMTHLRGELRLTRPAVLLTFDDGHRSWFEVAWPLLRDFGFHGVGFLVPTAVRQTVQDDNVWLSWAQVRQMEASGVMTFESHSARHSRIFTAPQLVDFVHPHYQTNPLGLDTPWISEAGKETNALHLGTPIYRHASRFADRLRYFDDPEVRSGCVQWVAAQGGERFFQGADWRKQLTGYFRTAARSGAGRYETAAQQRQAMLDDLRQARLLLEAQLQRPVRHLCYPWGVGCPLAVALSRQAGYQSNFWVATTVRHSNRAGDSPYHIPRLKDDYLLRLPGEGRQPLTSIFRAKLRRRAVQRNIY
jgi:peptidoglycan/xylan/chitin deacetylase (PgdA/CDA1 family)